MCPTVGEINVDKLSEKLHLLYLHPSSPLPLCFFPILSSSKVKIAKRETQREQKCLLASC